MGRERPEVPVIKDNQRKRRCTIINSMVFELSTQILGD